MTFRILKKIPKLPLTALLFYLGILALWSIKIIPTPQDILRYLENLYQVYGYFGLFIATFLESIAYLGLYIPGSFIIALAVFFSDGSFSSLAIITLVVDLALTITSIINYLVGSWISTKSGINMERLKKTEIYSKGIFVSMLHPNLLSFYFFNAGLERHNFKKIFIVPIFMLPYGFLVAILLSRFSGFAKQNLESPTFFLSIIVIWLVIAFAVTTKSP